MDPRRLLLTLRLDLLAAWRRARSAGAWRFGGTVVGGIALMAAEVWVTSRLTLRLESVPPLLAPLARTVVLRLELLVLQLTGAVAAASSVAVALTALKGLESEPFEAATPRPRAERAIVGWWRTLAGLSWVAVLAAPPLVILGCAAGRPGTAVVVLSAVLAGSAAVGTLVAVILAALVPRRVLLPAAWITATAAVVGAVLWLRSLHPERLAAATDPAAILAMLAAMGGAVEAHGPGRLLGGKGGALGALLGSAILLALAVAAWAGLGGWAGERLARGEGGTRGGSRLWRPLDRVLTLHPAGALLAARLRLLVRDTLQSSQLLYLLGLGAVYVENLRSLPLHDPLGREIAAVLNLLMAGLLAAALALRFAYPARLLGGPAWWWRSAPVGRGQADLAFTAAAALPVVLLSGGLFAAAAWAMGPGALPGSGAWLVPWLALWLSVAGVQAGPGPSDEPERWIDAALGGGGLVFLGVAVLAVGWCTAAAGVAVIVRVLDELGFVWKPPALLATPWAPVVILTAGLLLWKAVAHRRLGP